MLLPAIQVVSRSGSVGYFWSMRGFKVSVSQSMNSLPRPVTDPNSLSRKEKGEYSLKRPLGGR